MAGEGPGPLAVHIRTAIPPDLDAIEAVLRAAAMVWEQDRPFLEAHPEAIVVPVELVSRGQVEVAVIAGSVVGFASHSLIDAVSWEVEDLFVRPELMRRGIGRRLVGEMTRAAEAAGCIRLEVTANPQAAGFYRALGFVDVGMVATAWRPGFRMHRELG